jgi:hypothetical protein
LSIALGTVHKPAEFPLTPLIDDPFFVNSSRQKDMAEACGVERRITSQKTNDVKALQPHSSDQCLRCLTFRARNHTGPVNSASFRYAKRLLHVRRARIIPHGRARSTNSGWKATTDPTFQPLSNCRLITRPGIEIQKSTDRVCSIPYICSLANHTTERLTRRMFANAKEDD